MTKSLANNIFIRLLFFHQVGAYTNRYRAVSNSLFVILSLVFIEPKMVTSVETQVARHIVLPVVFGVVTFVMAIVSVGIILRRSKGQQITQLQSSRETVVALRLLANEVLLIYDKQDGQVRYNAASLHRTLSAAGISTVNFSNNFKRGDVIYF